MTSQFDGYSSHSLRTSRRFSINNVQGFSFHQLYIIHAHSRTHDDSRIKRIGLDKMKCYLKFSPEATVSECVHIIQAIEHIFMVSALSALEKKKCQANFAILDISCIGIAVNCFSFAIPS